MAKNEIEKKIDERAVSFERVAEKVAGNFEQRIKNWVKNDRIFDGFRNTYARVLLSLITWSVLLGYGAWVYETESSGIIGYTVAVALCVLAQKLSVRFVFDNEGRDLVDEYQRARRNLAYRRAYKRLGFMISGLLLLALAACYVAFYFENGYVSFWPNAAFFVQLDGYRIIVLLIFIAGLFTLQPYLAWGYKGEPFRSKNEPNI